jgi:transcriptional regulator with XRE-family HTH domain
MVRLTMAQFYHFPARSTAFCASAKPHNLRPIACPLPLHSPSSLPMTAPAPTRHLHAQLGPTRFNSWYEALIDLRIANPDMTQGERARRLGRTQAWVSLVENSDAFRAQYERRRAEHSKRISEHTIDKLHNVANKALDRLAETLDKKDLKPDFVLDATDTLFARLGYTAEAKKAQEPPPAPNGVVVQIVTPVDSATLRAAQTAIRAQEAAKIENSAHRSPPLLEPNSGPRADMPPLDPDAEELEVVSTPSNATVFHQDGDEPASLAASGV